jgi:predicted nucleotidyltransferase
MSRHESKESTSSVHAPLTESFSNIRLAEKSWPTNLVNLPVFREQIREHENIVLGFSNICSKVEVGKNIEVAISETKISEAEAVKFYRELTEYLNEDESNNRVILYFPFELLPNPSMHQGLTEVDSVMRRFVETYKRAWLSLTGTHDVRANFVDGDVLEIDLRVGDLPRVVKAAHLIPLLLQRRIIEVKDIFELLKNSKDSLLIDDILDALTVSIEIGSLSIDQLEIFEACDNSYIRNGIRLIKKTTTHENVEKESEAGVALPSFKDIFERLERDLASIPKHRHGATPERIAWLNQADVQSAITKSGECICKILLIGENLPDHQDLQVNEIFACIEGLRLASIRNRDVYGTNKEWVETLYTEHANFREAIRLMYIHLYHSGTIDETTLDSKGIDIPKLTGNLSENLKSKKELTREILHMTEMIKRDPFLANRVYPIVLVFGSTLKGYGLESADLDVAVFIKPKTARDDKDQVKRRLANIFNNEKIGGKSTLFWLNSTSDNDKLEIQNWDGEDFSDGEKSWTHVLFGASWFGNKKDIGDLHSNLLPNYFYDPGTLIKGQPARQRWLEELERDNLQYRLLHKGFGRFYSVTSQVTTKQADLIDGDTAFYDPRYRRLATQLYLEKVFLPKL